MTKNADLPKFWPNDRKNITVKNLRPDLNITVYNPEPAINQKVFNLTLTQVWKKPHQLEDGGQGREPRVGSWVQWPQFPVNSEEETVQRSQVTKGNQTKAQKPVFLAPSPIKGWNNIKYMTTFHDFS